jgi:Putative transposase, YhgA-like
MSKERIAEIIRQFPENGMKHLLQDPGNVHDLLTLCDLPFLPRLDFGRMTVDPTTYVSADFRHVSSDIVLQIPFRSTKGRGKRWLTLTILIEHQSQPDRLITLRVLDYMVQIYKSQVRTWGEEHKSLAGVRLRPVLPIVFYTGTHPWERLGTLTDLMTEGATFADVTPAFTPLFIDLPSLPPDRLGAAGPFGRVLQVYQSRKARREPFRDTLHHAIAELGPMAATERLRWLDLLRYFDALVFHARVDSEYHDLHGLIDAAVDTDPVRQEFEMARKTRAQVVEEKGVVRGAQQERIRSKQETLQMQLETRFGTLPPAVTTTIEATQDTAQLDGWLKAILDARSIQDVGIFSTK